MGDLLGGKEAGKPIAGDGAEESKPKESSKPNGNGPTSAPRDIASDPVDASKEQKTSEPGMTAPEDPDETTMASSLAAADFENPTTGGEVDAASALPAESESKIATSGGAGAEKDCANLGSILKGSAFEEGEAKTEAASQESTPSDALKLSEGSGGRQKTLAASANRDTVKPPSLVDKAVNGKPKESNAAQVKAHAKPVSEQSAASKTQGVPKPPATIDKKPSSKEPEKKEVLAKAAPVAAGNSSSKDKTPTSNPAPSLSTKTTAAPVALKKEAAPKKPETSKESIKESATGPNASTTLPDRKANRPTEGSKPSTSKVTPSSAPKPSKPPAKKVAHPTSPPTSGTGLAKPKPRSPTRPVNLPSHLTAQTAASAAKHGDESHVEPHKDQTAGKSKAPGPTAPKHPALPHRKAPRASMPAAGSSKAAEKEKIKPRMSVTGGSASGGSFLERMMRPTQSSAQKTADRVEPGKSSPPRKAFGSRSVSGSGPKTVTGGSTHKPDQHAHNDSGHGEGREKHSMPSERGAEHGESHAARATEKEKDIVKPAADSQASAPEAESVSASEEAKMPVAPGNTDERPTDEVGAAA